MKIFCHIPNEGWIVDRMGQEFKVKSVHDVNFTTIDNNTDLIWLLGSWCWNQIPIQVLKSLPVVCTVHHEVQDKFDENRKNNFLLRDEHVDYYLTYTQETKSLIESLSTKPVKIIPHWVNTDLWKIIKKDESQKFLNLPDDKFIIGSFQRDTEGSDLKSPKLEKGPDIFVRKVCDIAKFKDVHVLLGGWRRQYVIEKLKENNIAFSYLELPSHETVNIMYNALDLYIISSRCEGGPQSLFECAYLKVPLLSTKSGQHHFLDEKCKYDFEQILDEKFIKNANNTVENNFKNIKNLSYNKHIQAYDKFFEEILNNEKSND